MVLVGVKEENGWLLSRWNLTYGIGWEHILKAVSSVHEFYHNLEIIVDGRVVDINDKHNILDIPEASQLVFRGISEIIKAPVMITLYNQLQVVDVNVAAMADEFKNADYESFNKSMCQYLDSIELAMYR